MLCCADAVLCCAGLCRRAEIKSKVATRASNFVRSVQDKMKSELDAQVGIKAAVC